MRGKPPVSAPHGAERNAMPHRDRRLVVSALVAVLAALFVPTMAGAASPVLEFVLPEGKPPVSFMADGGEVDAQMFGFQSHVHCAASQGEGEIVGPRSTLSKYVFTGCVTQGGSDGGAKCKSTGANEEEIRTGQIEAELVYIDQAKHEVAMLLDPSGGTYIAFECGGESAEGMGPFLAPVDPLNKVASSFTATLSQSGSLQAPDEYENGKGERVQAVPMGIRGSSGLITTGVELAFTVHPSRPLEIRAITSAEIEVKQREEAAAAAQKRKDEEAATAKHHEEEVAARKAAEEAAKRKQLKQKALTRGQLLARALKRCAKEPKRKRAACRARAHKKYGHKVKPH